MLDIFPRLSNFAFNNQFAVNHTNGHILKSTPSPALGGGYFNAFIFNRLYGHHEGLSVLLGASIVAITI